MANNKFKTPEDVLIELNYEHTTLERLRESRGQRLNEVWATFEPEIRSSKDRIKRLSRKLEYLRDRQKGK